MQAVLSHPGFYRVAETGGRAQGEGNTGAETLVRGVEIVGTPLLSINKIIAT